ncbi:MAG TPA: ribosome assembly cofactor RimP [Candidatus Avidesulfovibrio excrementigallinarum]|nr:ribosome assembly cofactor RimP [Candidatus Avidesulfovibrio excrementigallinarum]
MTTDRITCITNIAAPLAASLGLEIWGAETAGAARPVVRLFVEKASSPASEGAPAAEPVQAGVSETADGVSIDQCAELSRLLGLALDVEDPFTAAWTLEISSPGLERTFFRLEQMRAYVGKEVDVTLQEAHPTWPVAENVPGRKKFRGTLREVGDASFVLAVPAESRRPEDPEQVEIRWDTVRRVHLVHIFPEPGLPGKGGRTAKKAPKRGDDA